MKVLREVVANLNRHIALTVIAEEVQSQDLGKLQSLFSFRPAGGFSHELRLEVGEPLGFLGKLLA